MFPQTRRASEVTMALFRFLSLFLPCFIRARVVSTMPLLKHAKRLRIPSTSVIDEELDEETQDASRTDDNPRKKVRWDGCDEAPDEDEEDESSSSGITEKVRGSVILIQRCIDCALQLCLAATCQL